MDPFWVEKVDVYAAGMAGGASEVRAALVVDFGRRDLGRVVVHIGVCKGRGVAELGDGIVLLALSP